MPELSPQHYPSARFHAQHSPRLPSAPARCCDRGFWAMRPPPWRHSTIRHWHATRADSIDEARDLLARWQGTWSEESEANWAVVDAATDALLGRISLKGVDLRDATAEVAYWICPGARGRGLCTQAVVTLSECAFRVAGFHRLALAHSTRNLASCRVAVKAGFLEEGIRRSAALHADGWHDMHTHARLSDDAEP